MPETYLPGLTREQIASLPRDKQQEILVTLEEQRKRAKENLFSTYYPDSGKLSRDKYQKHLEFFKSTAKYKEIAAICANRVGKTLMASYAVTCFLTGLYPEWWPGRRFNGPTRGWAAGTTSETCKDIIQYGLLGPPGHVGEGMLPKATIGKLTSKPGIPGAWDSVRVKHVSGSWSYLGLKSYNQDRPSFEGTAMDFIWLDEECPSDIYGECLLRTMTTRGIIMLTMTPLMGLSDVVLSFLPSMKPEDTNENA